MKTSLLSLMVAVAVLSGCSREAAAQPAPLRNGVQRTTPHGEMTVRALVPVKVSVVERSRTEHTAVVEAQIERVLGIDTPFSVQLALPAGVSVKRGRAQFTLAPNPEAVTTTETWELSFDAVPAQDALVTVDATTGAMGYHFAQAYRFGRAEPVPSAPSANGPRFTKGDLDFGPSIPLK